ncbi:MAG: hypothetical protein B7Y75_05740 [Azorhizobium sp. 35-67-5]|nr:MAG: hypothetical protein B7Y75_05740 [Azorhizobium sp. 35-67-5]
MGVDSWINNVAQDLPEQDARVLAATQTPLALTTFTDTVTTPAWTSRPNWYAISTRDRAVSVELQRELAARLKARTVELDASHMSLLSRPEEVAALIRDAVAAVAAG